MNTQLNLFPQRTIISSPSPVNKKRLGGQNLSLLKYLCEGKKINCCSLMMDVLGIGYLNSRCSDLKNKYGIDIKKKMRTTLDRKGQSVDVKEYWLEPEEIKRVKEIFEI